MSNHLTGKEIDYFVAGLASEKDMKKASEHLSSCSRCKKAVDVLSSVINEQLIDEVPGEHVKDSIMEHWFRAHNEISEKDSKPGPVIKRYIAGLAAAASVIIAVSSYLFFGIHKTDDVYPLAVTSVAGEVYLDNSRAANNTLLKNGSLIKTGPDGSASLTTDNYILHVKGSTSIEVTANSRVTGVRFKLIEGSVISKSSGNIIYSFECGKYTVAPAGTEFMLKLSGEKLAVSVTEGKVSVRTSGFDVEIPSGLRWSSENPDRVEPVDSETSDALKSGTEGLKSVEEKPQENKTGKTNLSGQTEKPRTIAKNDGSLKDNKENREKEEKTERIKLNRELREEISEIKKEQRKERKGRNRD